MQFNHDWLHFFLTTSYTGGEKTVNDNLSIQVLVFSTLLNHEQVSLISSALITDPQNLYGLHKDVAEFGWIRTKVCSQDLLLQATVFVVGVLIDNKALSDSMIGSLSCKDILMACEKYVFM